MTKKIIIIFILIGISTDLFSQIKKDRIKALKIAYLTEKLDLSVDEATQFWPIYNQYAKTEKQLKRVKRQALRKQIISKGGIDNFTDIQANEILAELLVIEDTSYFAKKEMITDLKKVISTKKIINLLKAEQEFNKRLLHKLRGRRQNTR